MLMTSVPLRAHKLEVHVMNTANTLLTHMLLENTVGHNEGGKNGVAFIIYTLFISHRFS